MQNKILIAEDDKDIVELLKLYLESSGFDVTCVYDGVSALEIFKDNVFDLIIADLMMPKLNGYELIKELRKTSNVPIIITSAKNMDSDKVLGLDIGADAYITKPFNPLELVAYVKALLRRCSLYKTTNNELDTINVGELSLDLNRYILKKMVLLYLLHQQKLKF